MHRPAINHTPLDRARRLLLTLEPLPPLPQLIDAAARRAATVLRVLRERHRPASPTLSEAIVQQSRVHLLRQRIRVAESDVGFVWRRLGGGLVEDLAHLGGLVFAPFADGTAAADGCVLLFDFGGAAGGDEWTEVVLKTAEGDQVRICLRGIRCVYL